MPTDGWMCSKRSKPATNSDMIWKIFHDSRDIRPDGTVAPRLSRDAIGISGGEAVGFFIFKA